MNFTNKTLNQFADHEKFLEIFYQNISRNLEEYLKYQKVHHGIFKEKIGLEFFDKWKCPLSPFILSKKHAENIADDLRVLIELIKSIPHRFFNGNWDDYFDFLSLPKKYTDLAMPFLEQGLNINFARPDGFVTDNSFKIIEANIGTGIGLFGQSQLWINYYKNNPLLSKIFNNHFINFIDPLMILSEFLKKSKNTTWFLKSKFGPFDFIRETFYNYEIRYLEKKLKHLYMRFFNPSSFQDLLSFLNNKKIRNIFIHFSEYQLLERRSEFKELLNLFTISKNISLVIPLIGMVFDNKLNLALLSENKNHISLTNQEKEVIQRCLPWTRKLNHSLAKIFLENKDLYVIKKSASHQGKHVYIGIDHSRVILKKILELALKEKDWIIQEYVFPVSLDNIFLIKNNLTRRKATFLANIFFIDYKIAGFHAISSIQNNRKGENNSSPHYLTKGGGGMIAFSDKKTFKR